ncbi:MAG: hypothetical protein KGN36_05060 [Acidobacteriota bacterium]|nr:hypothetical protein [Acidobacteriota bacterium]
MWSGFRGCLLVLAATAAWAQAPVNLVYLEPTGVVDTGGAEIGGAVLEFRRAADPARFASWTQNGYAARAFRLYRLASDIARGSTSSPPNYYIALVKGGNHAAVGFRIRQNGKFEDHAGQPYILLDQDPSRFDVTLLHETGHMIMALLAGGRQIEGETMTGIPHSTASLSDRNTAYNEGYATHLETLEAHVSRDPAVQQRFHRERIRFGDGPMNEVEYFHHSADLATYSQSLARYLEVRENNFAFESAFQGPDYLRVQLEKARDFSTLRDANQLLQSEGYYASFFFLWVLRGAGIPEDRVLDQREAQLMRAMKAAFATAGNVHEQPWLPLLVREYMKLYPAEKEAIADALDDTSHGVFVDPQAAALWQRHYFAALRLDVAKMNPREVNDARRRWREEVLADPDVLLSRIGPQVYCELIGPKIKLEAFPGDLRIECDANTVQPGIIRMIPGVTEEEVARWLAERARKPLTGGDDFQARGILSPAHLKALSFVRW